MVNSEFKMALIKPVEIILIGPFAWAQRTPYAPARNVYNLFYFVTEINPNMKVDATITKLGCTTYMTPSFKFIRLIHHY